MKHGIGWAIEQMEKGGIVCRRGWNGRNMYLGIHTPSVGDFLGSPFVYIKTVDERRIPWLCSATDLLATDYEEA